MFVDAVLASYAELRDYAQRLVADLDDAQMVAQPVPGVIMNHPAWILSHTAAYAPVLAGILRAQVVEDPVHHRFGRGSQPTSDTSIYLPRVELIAHWLTVHDAAAEALGQCGPERLSEPTPMPRWRSRFPTIGRLAMQFLVKHPATHLGQLSAWRRAMGLPPVMPDTLASGSVGPESR